MRITDFVYDLAYSNIQHILLKLTCIDFHHNYYYFFVCFQDLAQDSLQNWKEE